MFTAVEMKQSTLKAIMRLFALVKQFNGKPNTQSSALETVHAFLDEYTNLAESNEIINIYNYHVDTLSKRTYSVKSESLFSLKCTIICTTIVGELTKRTRLHLMLSALDILTQSNKLSEEALDLLKTLSIVLQIQRSEINDILAFSLLDSAWKTDNIITFSATKREGWMVRHIEESNIVGELHFLYNRITNTIFCKHTSAKELFIRNGSLTNPNRVYLLDKGGVIENYKIKSIFFGALYSIFSQTNRHEKISLRVKELSYRFPDGVMGIHPLNFTLFSGEMVGVIGNSGAGKTTLLNLLAGNLSPTSGTVYINGTDWYALGNSEHSYIGLIPQEDLLVKELTVFQNLYFTARLCLPEKSPLQTAKAVLQTLDEIGLSEIKRLKIGTPEKNIISGGQRKRLNMALEFIRKPQILFIDEPTSGLSSTDSDRIIDIIKHKSQQGAIALVNIHQPSSNIFKMFDKILVLDKGGRAVFFGNPIDSLLHLKTITTEVNSSERECLACGNVNPEQILSIIETKKLKSDGMPTEQRLYPPDFWYNHFLESNSRVPAPEAAPLPKQNTSRTSKFRQLVLFAQRNLLTMISDRQFLIISLIEAPLLALVLAFLSKQFGSANSQIYTLFRNENIPAYLLMSIIVAMFLGLMMGAERIIRDRNIIQREKFMGLSRFAYINSKLVCLFIFLFVQISLFVLVGNWILGITDAWFNTWLILFSIAFNAGLLGLNLSSGLKTSVAIYISIPILLMPQLLLNGSLIPFDKLHPAAASHQNVPAIANLSVSRWGFEALLVNQFVNNRYQKLYHDLDQQESQLRYFSGYLIPEIEHVVNEIKQTKENTVIPEDLINILTNGIEQLGGNVQLFKSASLLSQNKLYADSLLLQLQRLRRIISSDLNAISRERDSKTLLLIEQLGGTDQLAILKAKYSNQAVRDLVLSRKEPQKIVRSENTFVRKFEPIFAAPTSNWGNAHFLSQNKKLWGLLVSTIGFNILIIWIISLFLYIALYFDWLKKVLAQLLKQ
ncbi:MAG: ATP-binding cassette domain-containing protein [Tenuifilaceae bacterium]|jgi:ABC-type multidrug transport system ATPase subunit|nr:ATP-binding cassette domain-containing protein [Tenuifilaceae bacterium]